MIAIALDDEPPALEVLEEFCARVDFIELKKTFTSTGETLNYLEKYPVDLLFFDINMPLLTGIDLYKMIPHKAMIIFTTAYSEYAVEGYNLNAIDYLLKPFTYERFLQAVNKANDYFNFLRQGESTRDQYLQLRIDYSLVKIAIADILFIEGLDNYMKIHLHNQKPVVVRMTRKALLEKLPSKQFVRVHRSYIVSLSRIESVRNKIIFIAGEEIPIGNNYEESFFAYLRR